MATGGRPTGGGPSENELLKLSREVTVFWYTLGIRLGLTTGTLDNIDGNNVRFGSPQRKAFQMLVEWSHSKETPSYDSLSQALREEGKAELARKYCGHRQSAGCADQEHVVEGQSLIWSSLASCCCSFWPCQVSSVSPGETIPPRRLERIIHSSFTGVCCSHYIVGPPTISPSPKQMHCKHSADTGLIGVALAGQSAHEVNEGEDCNCSASSRNQQSEHLREQLSELEDNESATSSQPQGESEGNKTSSRNQLPQPLEGQVTKLESILKKEYSERASTYVTPFPWLEDWQLVLDDIFIKVRMVERDNQRFGELRGEERSMYDIFEPDKCGKSPRFVLVEGAPGIGKTVFCQKLATDWSKGQTGASFPNFRIVLNLKCRDIQSTSGRLDRKALEDSIVDQLLPDEAPDELRSALFEYMKTPECEVLLVLDGLDEFRGAVDVEGLRRQLRYWHCKFLFTSRNDPKLRKSCDSLYQIVGFTPEDAESYINKFFGQGGTEMAALLFSKIEDGGLLRDLVTNPLSTSLLCFVFNETGGKLPSSKAKLYEELVCCVLRRKHKKNGQEPPQDPLATHQEDLALLGRLALKGIEKGQLHFSNDEFKAEGRATDVLHFGFLSKEKSTSKRINSPCCHQFVHKTVQEFFAALHFCVELLSADSENCLRRLGRMSDDELLLQYKQVLLFLSTMLSEKGKQGKPAASRFFSSLARREGGDGGEFGELIVDLVHECAAVNAEFGEAMIHPVVSSWAVKRLDLVGRQMTEADVGFRVACAVVKANRPLEELYLNDNNIRDLSGLSAALRTNTSLRALTLDGNPQLTAESVGGLAAALAQHTGLEELWLDEEFSGEPAIQNFQEQNQRLRIHFMEPFTRISSSSEEGGGIDTAEWDEMGWPEWDD